jgi:hypothetical protein
MIPGHAVGQQVHGTPVQGSPMPARPVQNGHPLPAKPVKNDKK